MTSTKESDAISTEAASTSPASEWERAIESRLAQIEQTISTADAGTEEPSNEYVSECELSIVMPCLNEADTLAICIQKCNQVIEERKLDAEVVIADNGSTDGSIEIAREHGARVVNVAAKGYGNALMGGIEAARGKFVIMGDADDSYNFLEVPKFVEKLRAGHALVQGCRLPSGGGTVEPGAMPFSHRWIGNPMFSAMVRRMFNAPIHDVYCGLRGFTKQLYRELNMRSPGMEFATEMIIKASLFRKDIAEVPITLHPDGRKAHAPHLRTFRDGWRTLRFFLINSPTWLFSVPGNLMLAFGLLCFFLAMPATAILGVRFDAHTMLFGSTAIFLGCQLKQFAQFSKSFAIFEGLLPDDPEHDRLINRTNLERGVISGAGLTVLGVGLLAVALNQWRLAEFGSLSYPQTMRLVIPGMTFVAVGAQFVFSSFFLGILRMKRANQ